MDELKKKGRRRRRRGLDYFQKDYKLYEDISVIVQNYPLEEIHLIMDVFYVVYMGNTGI
jgi:hypothetical protein